MYVSVISTHQREASKCTLCLIMYQYWILLLNIPFDKYYYKMAHCFFPVHYFRDEKSTLLYSAVCVFFKSAQYVHCLFGAGSKYNFPLVHAACIAVLHSSVFFLLVTFISSTLCQWSVKWYHKCWPCFKDTNGIAISSCTRWGSLPKCIVKEQPVFSLQCVP